MSIENLIRENDPDNNQNENSSEVTEVKKPSLEETMRKVIEESQTQSISSENNETNTPAQNPLSEIEKTDWFKSLPQESKDLIRSGAHIDPELNELNSAVARNQEEILEEINKEREALGQEKLKSFSELQNVRFEVTKDDEDIDDEEKEILKLIKEEEGESSEEQLSETEAVKKTSLTFEKMLEEADVADFAATPVTEWSTKSAALDVKIVRNKEYEENVKSVLEANDIKFKVTKKDKLKRALLHSFIQRNNHVTTPLVNSGIYVTLSGASIPEIINMNSIEAQSRAQMDIKKLAFIKKHLVDTSIGKNMSLHQFMKLISYKDLQTLYFNLFVGTFPEVNEFPTTCANEKCKIPLKLNIHTSDMVLNADEFEEQTNYILYKNQDIKDVLEQSVVSKEIQIRLNNGMLIRLRHPSIYDMINVYARVEEEVSKKRLTVDPTIAGYLLYITMIALPEDGEYVRFDSMDELLEILSAVDEDTLYEIDEHIEKYVKPLHSIRYGIKSYICPVCKHVHPEQTQPMDEFLFTVASIKLEVKKAKEFRKREERNKKQETK